MQKTCGHCHRSFLCQQEGGCWCGTVKLDSVQLAWIKQRYENCLCPRCLAAVAAGTLSDRSIR
ncbi:MAG: cysteine-rich CWC family protein [Nitrospirota bacterium]|nr:cysteine-rich CWC family protein [Nitrospirota bacterium]